MLLAASPNSIRMINQVLHIRITKVDSSRCREAFTKELRSLMRITVTPVRFLRMGMSTTPRSISRGLVTSPARLRALSLEMHLASVFVSDSMNRSNMESLRQGPQSLEPHN